MLMHDQRLYQKKLSSFIFSIKSTAAITNLFEMLLVKVYYNDRNEDRVVFFKDSWSRISKLNVVTMAHAMSQKWNFAWPRLSKDEHKAKLIELCKENITF